MMSGFKVSPAAAAGELDRSVQNPFHLLPEEVRLLEWLRSLFGAKTLTVTDQAFGAMRGQSVAYGGRKYVCWHALAGFFWQGQEASIRVYSDERGPTQRQRELFAQFRRRYPDL